MTQTGTRRKGVGTVDWSDDITSSNSSAEREMNRNELQENQRTLNALRALLVLLVMTRRRS